MEPLVSIIIPEFEDDTYLIRCLNSIKRQTYQNYEIIVVNDMCGPLIQEKYGLRLIDRKENWCNGLNEAMRSANGEYLLFCKADMVLAPNVLEQLLKDMAKIQIFYTGQCCSKNKAGYENSAEITLYGKLFLKEIIEKKQICFSEADIYTDVGFVLRYTSDFEKIETDDKVYIYGTEFGHFSSETEFINRNTVTSFLDLCKENLSEEHAVQKILEAIIRDCEDEDKILAAMKVKEIYGTAYEINYSIAEKYTSVLFKQCLLENNEIIFEELKAYLKLFEEDKDFLKIMLPLFNMNQERYEICLAHSLEEYLFYKDKLKNDKEKGFLYEELNEKIEKIEKELTVLRLKKESEKVIPVSSQNQGIETRSNVVQISGPELAEYVVQTYRQGGLGLKTLVRAFGGWLRYKF